MGKILKTGYFALFIYAALCIGLAAQVSAKSCSSTSTLGASQSKFAHSLQKVFNKQVSSENFSFSPLSIHAALSMVYTGAEGKTKREIDCAIRTKSIKRSKLLDSYRQQLASVTSDQTDGLKIANSLWTKKLGNRVSRSFSDSMTGSFDAELKKLGNHEDVNQWVNENTDGMVPELFKKPFGPGTQFVLANAVAFEDEWQSNLELLPTPSKFYSAEGKQSGEAQLMMTDHSSFKHKKSKLYSTVEIPYKGSASMFIIYLDYDQLPEGRSYLKQLKKLVNSGKLNISKATEGTTKNHMYHDLKIPKFSIRSPQNMVPHLKKLQIKSMFKCGQANLDGIISGSYTKGRCTLGKSLFIKKFVHETAIDVDENGTKAGSGTGVVGAVPVSEPPPSVVINRPFLFAVKDTKADTILFQGWVSNPSK